MHRPTTLSRPRTRSWLLLAGLCAGCATSPAGPTRPPIGDVPIGGVPIGGLPGAGVSGERAARALAAPAQGDIPSMDQVHPRTMITFGVGIGEQTNEFNSGAGIATSATSAQRFRLRAEHYFESGFGVFAEGQLGRADDILEDLGAPDSSQDTATVFVAAAYRATVDDDFRLPVRFGPFLHRTETENSASPFGTLERSTFGVQLSAEPEFIIFQSNRGGRISELSAFAEIRTGAGPTDVQDNTDDEDAYAFTLDYEFGVRYRFGFGLLASLSYVGSKYHVGASESYNNVVFFGLDDDFNGVMITAGARF